MTPEEIMPILGECCSMFRKGDPVTEHLVGEVKVTEVWNMPSINDREKYSADLFVDVHFVWIGIDMARAEKQRAPFIAQCDSSALLATGPSYIAIAMETGGQDQALCFMALGEALGLWRVVTPERLHLPLDMRDRAAGMGWVMISGYRNGETTNERDSGGAPVGA